MEIVVITFEIPTTQLMFILHAEQRAGEVSQAVFVTQKTSKKCQDLNWINKKLREIDVPFDFTSFFLFCVEIFEFFIPYYCLTSETDFNAALALRLAWYVCILRIKIGFIFYLVIKYTETFLYSSQTVYILKLICHQRS